MGKHGERKKSGQRLELANNLLVPVIQLFSLVLIFWLSLLNRTFLYDTNGSIEFYIFAGTIFSLPFFTYFLHRKRPTLSLYSNALEIFLYILLVPIFLKSLTVAPLIIIPILAAILKVDRTPPRHWVLPKTAIFVFFSLAMYILGSLLQIIPQPEAAPVALVPLASIFIFPGQSLPILFYYGMNLYGSFLTITLSPLTLIVFTVVAALVAENYEGFFRILRSTGKGGLKSAVFGVTAALSCQCEACISLLPAMVFIIITVAMIPLIIESLLLLVLSNILIRSYLSGREVKIFEKVLNFYSRKQVILASLLVISLTPTELVGLYLGWLRNPVFFFGMGMIDVLTGYILVLSLAGFYHIGKKPFVYIAFLISGFAISLMWYYPPLTLMAFSNGTVFSIMAAAGLGSGILFGLAHRMVAQRYLVPEIVSLVYGFFTIGIFYLTVNMRTSIWVVFPYVQTVIFEILAWALMLPVMWFFTQVSLAAAPKAGTSFILQDTHFAETAFSKDS